MQGRIYKSVLTRAHESQIKKEFFASFVPSKIVPSKRGWGAFDHAEETNTGRRATYLIQIGIQLPVPEPKKGFKVCVSSVLLHAHVHPCYLCGTDKRNERTSISLTRNFLLNEGIMYRRIFSGAAIASEISILSLGQCPIINFGG
jgi:hypothetical protein